MSDDKTSAGAPQGPIEPPTGTQPTTVVERPGRPWLPVLIATIVALVVLALILIPGVLLYPEEDTTAEDRARMLALQQESNNSLEERIAKLKALVEADICVAPDGYFRRNEEGELEPFGPAEEALLPRAAQNLPLPEEAAPELAPAEDSGEQASLVDLLDAATVMVLAPETGAQGTGFFVAPGIAVTNMHVVGNRPEQPLVVLGKGLKQPMQARIIASTGSVDFFTPDFALLKVQGAEEMPFLRLSAKAERLQDVVAAGYPSLLNETDEDIRRLASGDMRSMPDPSVTSGVITAQQAPRGAPVLVHTATISGGSSGGPLVDHCGRVVGVNTFIRNQQQDGGRMNYALATPSLASFLTQHGVAANASDQACGPTG